MENMTNRSSDEIRIQGLLDAYLSSRKTLKSSAAETSFHLDEDSLTAFAEGTMSRRESEPAVAHLVDCGFCRHKTAELIRLDLRFAETADPSVHDTQSEPSKISEVISGIFAKIFGSSEEAVFAHNEKKSDEEPAEEKEEEEKK